MMIGILFLLLGGQAEGVRDTHPLIGEWVVDWDMSLPRLDEKLDALEQPPEEKANIRKEMIEIHQVFGLVFSKNTRTKVVGDKTETNRWTVVAHDENNLLHNETYLLRIDNDGSIPEHNSLTLEQLVERGHLGQGIVPYCIALEFLDDNHLLSFNIRVRDHRITKERDYSWLVFKRGDGKQLLPAPGGPHQTVTQRQFRPADCVGTWIFDTSRSDAFAKEVRRFNASLTPEEIAQALKAHAELRYEIREHEDHFTVTVRTPDGNEQTQSNTAKTLARNEVQFADPAGKSKVIFRFRDRDRVDLIEKTEDITVPLARFIAPSDTLKELPEPR